MDNNLLYNLPNDILHNIVMFLDKTDFIVRHKETSKLLGSSGNWIFPLYKYIDIDHRIHLIIDKTFYKLFTDYKRFYKCNICDDGFYNLDTQICSNCCHRKNKIILSNHTNTLNI